MIRYSVLWYNEAVDKNKPKGEFRL